MISLKQINKRVASVLGTALLISGVALPAAFPVMASAASLDSRSITMSSSQPAQTGVKYNLEATLHSDVDSTGGGIIIEFCSNSPLIGLSCTHPTGMDVSSVTTTGSTTAGTATSIDATDKSTIKWVPSSNLVGSGSPTINVTFNGITNPTDEGTFYARITTYKDNVASATTGYQSATSVGDTGDTGGIALAIVKKIAVTAYVQESLTFCVSGDGGNVGYTGPDAGCVASTVHDPSMQLGQETSAGSGIFVLDTQNVSTGTDWAQLGTNAAHGAVVNLHSDATGCGGLVRINDTPGNCDIGPQDQDSSTNTISAGDALFGLTVSSDTAAPNGTSFGGLTSDSKYSASNYFIDYVSGDATGVTSTYGSPLFDSTDPNNASAGPGPVANRNISFTFGASQSAATPAGIYSANLMLVATGTF